MQLTRIIGIGRMLGDSGTASSWRMSARSLPLLASSALGCSLAAAASQHARPRANLKGVRHASMVATLGNASSGSHRYHLLERPEPCSGFSALGSLDGGDGKVQRRIRASKRWFGLEILELLQSRVPSSAPVNAHRTQPRGVHHVSRLAALRCRSPHSLGVAFIADRARTSAVWQTSGRGQGGRRAAFRQT
jgi:hypothetical protein